MGYFIVQAPKRVASCKICNGDIPIGEDAVALYARVSGNRHKLFFHYGCFPIERAKIPTEEQEPLHRVRGY